MTEKDRMVNLIGCYLDYLPRFYLLDTFHRLQCPFCV